MKIGTRGLAIQLLIHSDLGSPNENALPIQPSVFSIFLLSYYKISAVSQSPKVLGLFLVVVFLSVIILFDRRSSNESKSLSNLVSGRKKIHPMLKKWKECMLTEAEKFRGNYEQVILHFYRGNNIF